MFRTALIAATPADVQRVPAMQKSTTLVFQVQYEYMLGAFALMLLCVASICYILVGWWDLGRDVSLSPLEISKAFNAPFLESNQSSNADVDTLLKGIGERKVQYGEVRFEIRNEQMGSDKEENPTKATSLRRLEMNRPDSAET